MAPQILLVDDDPGLTRLVAGYLARFGLHTHSAGDGAAMQRMLAAWPIDLVLLDVMLPGSDGLALARALRAASRVPIIMLSAGASAADRVVGLELGADDYISKPFEPRELVARIHTVLRRAAAAAATPPPATPQPQHSDVVRFDGWALQRQQRRLTAPSGQVVSLSNAEYQLLDTFLQAPRRVVSRNHLLAQARGRALDGLNRSIDMLVSRLRQKLLDGSGNALIQTVRGAGYVFNARLVHGSAAVAGALAGTAPS